MWLSDSQLSGRPHSSCPLPPGWLQTTARHPALHTADPEAWYTTSDSRGFKGICERQKKGLMGLFKKAGKGWGEFFFTILDFNWSPNLFPAHRLPRRNKYCFLLYLDKIYIIIRIILGITTLLQSGTLFIKTGNQQNKNYIFCILLNTL